MSISNRFRTWLVDSPDSIGERARAKRWAITEELFPNFRQLDVVDLGGTVESWMRAPLKPRAVVVVNLFEPGRSCVDWITAVQGDACEAVQILEQTQRKSTFDLVYSNAVLEHVGGHAQRARFAAAVRELAPRHWIQTPYRYFPLEPHWLFPGMQFLPLATRAQIALRWPLAHTPASTLEEARSSVLWTELIGITEMRELFPDSHLVHERIAGVTKSIIAVKS